MYFYLVASSTLEFLRESCYILDVQCPYNNNREKKKSQKVSWTSHLPFHYFQSLTVSKTKNTFTKPDCVIVNQMDRLLLLGNYRLRWDFQFSPLFSRDLKALPVTRFGTICMSAFVIRAEVEVTNSWCFKIGSLILHRA